MKDLSIEKNTSTSSIPIKLNKKQLQQKPKSVNVSDTSSQRKPLRSGTIAQQQQKSTTTPLSKKATTLTSSNRSKIPNSNIKTKPVTVSTHMLQ